MSSIDVLKENMKFQQLLKENNNTSILKEEYLIPDTHPDVSEILTIEAVPKITSKELVNEKIIIEGNVEYTVIYIPREDDSALNSVNYSEKFSSYLELSNIEHKINCEVECKIEHIQAKVMNERKIEIEGIVNIGYELYKDVEIEYVKDIQGTGDVQVLKEKEKINRIVGSKNGEIESKSIIRVGMDKPQISKILDCSLMLHKKEVKVLENKIHVACYCKVNIIYLGEETGDVVTLEDDVYVSQEEDMEDIVQGMISYGNFEIDNINLLLQEDDLGENRIINTDFYIKYNIKVFSNDNISLIKDAYSPKKQLEIKESAYELGIIKDPKYMETVIIDTIPISAENKIENIISQIGNVIITDKNIMNDKMMIEGIIKVNILYKSGNEKRYDDINGEIPFSTAIEIPGLSENMKAIIKCDLENIETAIEINNIAIKANITLIARVFYEVEKKFIADVIETENEVEKNKSSITIYVVGRKDTLWDLAKKYSTTVEELMKLNEIDEIEPGDKILIPGKACF